MSLQNSWVEHLFGRLSVRYGASFLRQYEGLDMAAVMADWAEVLDGVSGESLSYALRYLPAERPPNALQFRDICRRAPSRDAPALPPPDVVPDPQRVQRMIAQMLATQASLAGMSPAEQCASNIMDIAAAREGRLSIPQRQQLRAMGYQA